MSQCKAVLHPVGTESALQETMEREVGVLREILSSMRQEQQAIIHNDAELVKTISTDRESLINVLYRCREKRNKLMKQLTHTLTAQMEGDICKSTLEEILKNSPTGGCEILSLREQILSLVDQLKKQGDRNSYLLENRVYLTKEMIRRLYPDNKNPMYSAQGTLAQRAKTTVMVINREV